MRSILHILSGCKYVSSSSENSGVAELKENGQVSCDTAHNLHLTCSYITRGGRTILTDILAMIGQ